MKPRGVIPGLALVLLATVAAAGEPDWFTRVKEMGLAEASKREVARYERGVLPDSHHVGECYYHLGRWEEGVAVFRRLLHSPDRNYAAAALVRVGEGRFHLGKREEAREAFTRALREFPEAWYDGSVADRSRAWLAKLEGKLASPAPEVREARETGDLEALRAELRELSERLAELRALIERLSR